MNARRQVAVTAAASTVFGLIASVVALAPPAHADEATDAPRTRNDRITVGSVQPLGDAAFVDVLANDRDPNGDRLEICRIEIPPKAPLVVQEADGDDVGVITKPASGRARAEEASSEQLLVAPRRNRNGTYRITYYACDKEYLTPATLVVHVKRVPRVKVHRIRDVRGVLKFVNPTRSRVAVLYGSFRNGDPDGRLALSPTSTARQRVFRRNIDWVAIVVSTGEVAGRGKIRNIRIRPNAGHHDGRAVAIDARSQRVWDRVR